jgi:hypothetical protein
MINNEQQLIEKLEQMQTKAPAGFQERVMSALPANRKRSRWVFWPAHGEWILPALAGSLATLLIVFSIVPRSPQNAVTADAQMTLHFELHAPGAEKVELVGSFNNWQSGDIILRGPDASGHWTADVALPEGQYEYMFLVDGKRWVADPNAKTYQSDGFGRVNAVIKVYDDDNNS